MPAASPSPSPTARHYQAVVVGGGLTGRAAAMAVARTGLETLHLAPAAPPDNRTSALMLPSVDWLLEAGLIDAPEALGEPLTRIRIIDATRRLLRAPETLFEAAESGLDAFGWNFPNRTLGAAFEAAAADLSTLTARPAALTGLVAADGHWQLDLADGGRLTADLVVGADGKKSLVRTAGGFRVRERAFAEAALVCDLELERPLEGTSVEFHYPRGPFTLVPAGGLRANLVWIDDRPLLEAARRDRETLVTQLADKSQRLFGAITPVTPAFVFPLSTLSVDRAGGNGIALVGEAAHAFPPIGAQGLNLGLRDVADLSAALAVADPGRPDWAAAVSADYARRRTGDLARTGGVVDALFRSLLAEMLPAQVLRSAGLWALKLLPPLRRRAFEIGMGARSRA